MDLDHWDQAIEHFERVRRRIGGRDVVVLRELARAWAAKGDDARALLLIDRAYRLQPLNAGIMVFYAALLDRSGKAQAAADLRDKAAQIGRRSEEHTSELQSLMRISYAVFCLNKNIR